MTRFHRVRPFVLPSAALCALLLPALHTAPLRAQAGPGAPPPNWTVPDDPDPGVVDWSDDIPAHLAVVDGSAYLGRDATEEAATENVPLLAGDRLRTTRGRVEVAFDDGSALDLDEGTTVDLLSDSLIRLQTGRLRLTLARGSASAEYRVDAAGTTIVLRAGGEYRVSVDAISRTDPTVAVAVTRGSAEIASPYGRSLVRPGYEATASAGTEPSLPYAASVAAYDAFGRWADDLSRDRAGVVSARYLPTEIRSYGGLFDRYGDWQFDGSYGYVWYPRVDSGWRPYYAGEWSYIGSYGWFWVGADRWSWPTHHYGRWGMSGARWYWIPDRRWSPAWVSWAVSAEYVSWSPLGYNNRPLLSINLGYSSSPWRAWTAVPANRFGNTIIVNARSRASSVPVGARFVERQSAPFRPSAVRADARPIRSPGSRAQGGYAVARAPSRGSVTAETGGGRVTDDRRLSTQMGLPSRSNAQPRDPSRPSTSAGASSNPSDRATRMPDRTNRSYSPSASSQPQSLPNRGATYRRDEAPVRSAPPATSGAPTSLRTRQAPETQPRPSSNTGSPRISQRGPANSPEPRTRTAEPQRQPEAARAPAAQPTPSRAAPPRTEAPQAERARPAGRTAPSDSNSDRARSRR
jgi:FecR protein